ncbi:MAG: hypothetical protein AB1451_12365 [Nitrospirota bacterium]
MTSQPSQSAMFRRSRGWCALWAALVLGVAALVVGPSSAAAETVIVEVTGAPLIGSVALTVGFDQRLVAFEGATASGAAAGALTVVNPQPGQGWVKVGMIKADGFGSGEILRLTFRTLGTEAQAAGVYPVQALTVTDLSGRPLPAARAVVSVSR